MFLVHISVALVRDGRLLMVTESKPDVHGMLNLPGGRLEHGEALADAAVREAREETGLDVAITGIIGVYTAVSTQDNHILRFVFRAACDHGEPAAGDDILAVGWHSIGELQALPDNALAGAPMLREILRSLDGGTVPLGLLHEATG